MILSLHKNATTTPAIRAKIVASEDPAAVLATRYGVTLDTIYRHKHLASTASILIILIQPAGAAMTDVFISHAVADKDLADKFVAFLKEAIGVPAKSIFCSSIDGQNIPLGVDFNDYMKERIQKPKLVILLITPRYMESWFCLMELGATWAQSLKALPIVVPPVKFSVVSSTLGLRQGWSIDNEERLNDLRDMVRSTGISLERRTDHDWDKKRAVWKADLKKLIKKLAPATKVSASDYEALQAELHALKQALGALQEAYEEAGDTIDELKAAKDAVAVKTIMVKKKGSDVGSRFKELLENISVVRPRVSAIFFRNIIMDHYGKAIPIDWFDGDQRNDAESAVQYNIMDAEVPHNFRWDGKLKKLAIALNALDAFLQSEEAANFVKKRISDGHVMDTDDLEFWEENL
jgi:hypothetical protein